MGPPQSLEADRPFWGMAFEPSHANSLPSLPQVGNVLRPLLWLITASGETRIPNLKIDVALSLDKKLFGNPLWN